MIAPSYRAQVDLILQILPYVATEEVFALNGGTAINLFIRELPRLSVDLDLTYLPFDSRESAFQNIHAALERISNNISSAIKGIKVTSFSFNGGTNVKLNCQYKNAQIKIEVNAITRGHISPTRFMQVKDKVQDEFGKFAAINLVSHAELYGGKICAALDRQHPRDLFDVKLLLDNEGFSDELRFGFIAGLLSHNKPIHEILNPILKDQKSAYSSQFAGMAFIEFSYDDYKNTRNQLIEMINKSLTKEDKKFLHGFVNGNPNWEISPNKRIKDLPAVQWKLQNINILIDKNTDKHEQLMKKLRDVLF